MRRGKAVIFSIKMSHERGERYEKVVVLCGMVALVRLGAGCRLRSVAAYISKAARS